MGRRIEISPGFCVLWALLLLLLPLRLLAAAVAAALFHELCHALAIRLLGGEIVALTVGAGGMVMETTPLSRWRELLCALAGPAGSFLLILIQGWFPFLALCGFVQGCFNLLPLYPLDGGRALRCCLEMLGLPWLQNWIEWVALAVLLAVAVGLQMGLGPIVAWGMLAMRKIPCKDGRFGVQ